MPTTTLTAALLPGFISPSSLSSLRFGACSGPCSIVGQSLAECPTSRHAKHVVCTRRPAMRFNRRASDDVALSTAAVVYVASVSIITDFVVVDVYRTDKQTRTLGPLGLFLCL